MVLSTWTSLLNLKRTSFSPVLTACVFLVRIYICFYFLSVVASARALRLSNIDNYWLDTKTPCLTYGLRGINYYEIKISGPDRDLHSGVFGGTVHEPMTDLIALSKQFGTHRERADECYI